MQLRVRWYFFEALKFAIVLGLFAWVQASLAETKYEVYAAADPIVDRQAQYTTRIIELEKTRLAARERLARTDDTVENVRKTLARQSEMQQLQRHSLEQLIDNRSVELRAQIQEGIERLEGTTYSAFNRSKRVDERVARLELRMRRTSRELKELMLYPITQLRGNGTVGSGVVIASIPNDESKKVDTYVVTAYHVVLEIMDGAPESTTVEDLRFLDPVTDLLEEDPREAELLASNRDADLALLHVEMDERWQFVAQLASPEQMARASIFDSVYAVGCPLGNKPLPTVGEISCQKKLVGGQNFWMVNAPTFFGNSGGGVFLSDSGRLAGISSMIYTYGKKQPMVVPHMGLFVPLPTVREWLVDEGYGFTLDYAGLAVGGADPGEPEVRPASLMTDEETQAGPRDDDDSR